MRNSTTDIARAGEGLREGDALLLAGKPKKAITPLIRALDSLQGADASDGEAQEILRAVAARLENACRLADKPETLIERRPDFFRAGLHRGAIAEALIRSMVFDERRTDPDALSMYVAYVAARGALDEPLKVRLNQVLSFGLHIRLASEPEEVAHLVPILEKLRRIRPRLAYPPLYLGRYHYILQHYGSARELLQGVHGKLGESPKVLNIRARCAEKLHLFDESLVLYRESLKRDHHQPHVHFRVGRILLGRFHELAGQKLEGA